MPLPVNERLTEALGVLGKLGPLSRAAATYLTAAINVSGVMKTVFILSMDTPAGGSTIDFKVSACATSGGSYTDVAGAAIVQVTAGTTPIVMIEIDNVTLAGAGQGPFLKGNLVVGTAANVNSLLVLAAHPHYAPASDGNITIAQTVVV